MFLNEKSQKKMFFPNIFMNSEEFKDLGTLHYERRNADYFANEEARRMSGTGAEFYIQPFAGSNPQKKWKQK
jgi:hypothetical protein